MGKHNLLYLCYWGLSDGLTQATAFPHLQLLLNSERINKVVFITIERNGNTVVTYPILMHPKIVFVPLISKGLKPSILNKINDFLIFPSQLRGIVAKYKIDKVIARGAPAGALMLTVCRNRNIPLYVESFEPHADYMLTSGVWKRWDPRYIFQKKWEAEIKKKALGLMPVAENYTSLLKKEGVPKQKLFTVPCSVNHNQFIYDSEKRMQLRTKLNIPIDVHVGIYVGKFGGIYFEDDAFLLFKRILNVSNTHIIILTPDSKEKIKGRLIEFELPQNRFHIDCVSHLEVSDYLSCADFAFSLHKRTRVSFYYSPIKNGEYWAAGLPVIISEDIGDDSELVKKNNCGNVLPYDWKQKPDTFFKEMIQDLTSMNRSKIRTVALTYRNVQSCVDAYSHFQLI